MLQLTSVAVAIIYLLAAWKETLDQGEELRSSREASSLLVGKEAQCVTTLTTLSENLRRTEEKFEALKQENEAKSVEAADLRSKILEGKSKVDREREEMREAEKQNREVQLQIRSTLDELEQVKQKIEAKKHSPQRNIRKKLEFESDTDRKLNLKASGNEDIVQSVNK